MNKISISFLFILSLFMASCSNNDEPETYPIKFGKMDYTIRFATTTRIDFTDGGGKYELKASNPDVLGSFYIDGENHSLVVCPSSTGESTLTVTDVKMNTTVTLNFIVEDFYLSFRVFEIEGDNHNPYLSIGNEIRFIRDDENTRQMKVMWQNKMTYEIKCIAHGSFDIERCETNIFTLNMSLHSHRIEELETFSYTLGGDGEYLSVFESIFDYKWENSIASKSQPIKQINMILTDPFNDCRISCSLQPF